MKKKVDPCAFHSVHRFCSSFTAAHGRAALFACAPRRVSRGPVPSGILCAKPGVFSEGGGGSGLRKRKSRRQTFLSASLLTREAGSWQASRGRRYVQLDERLLTASVAADEANVEHEEPEAGHVK